MAVDEIEEYEGEFLTFHELSLQETGKEILKESHNVPRNFNEFMIKFSFGAIGVYITLLEFILDKDTVLSTTQQRLNLIAPFLFLISSIVFIIGYFPVGQSISLDLLDDIEKYRNDSINTRINSGRIGTFIFTLGTFIAVLILNSLI